MWVNRDCTMDGASVCCARTELTGPGGTRSNACCCNILPDNGHVISSTFGKQTIRNTRRRSFPFSQRFLPNGHNHIKDVHTPVHERRRGGRQPSKVVESAKIPDCPTVHCCLFFATRYSDPCIYALSRSWLDERIHCCQSALIGTAWISRRQLTSLSVNRSAVGPQFAVCPRSLITVAVVSTLQTFFLSCSSLASDDLLIRGRHAVQIDVLRLCVRRVLRNTTRSGIDKKNTKVWYHNIVRWNTNLASSKCQRATVGV